MRMQSLVGALVLSMVAGSASAEHLALLCHVRETRPGGAHRELKRRLDIDLSARTVSYYDDVGHGWEFKREGPYVSADAHRIRLDDGAGKEAYVDRQTGEYAFHNERDGLTIRGPCVKTLEPRPKF
jgi:hypothetical protein